MISERIPKKLQQALSRHADVIQNYYMEDDGFGDKEGSWSIWIHLKPGLICPEMECGTIHEADAMKAVEKLAGVERAPAPDMAWPSP